MNQDTFVQVGKDAAATRFLSALDVDPVIGGMVDTTSYFEQEQEEYARKVRGAYCVELYRLYCTGSFFAQAQGALRPRQAW